MTHKITIRLSDKEYYLLEFMAKHYKNNKSKAVRELIANYADMINFITPIRTRINIIKELEDDLPFT